MKYLILCLSLSVMGATVAIKNFREIYESLQVSTSISPVPESPLHQLYKQVEEILPTSGKADEYNASMQWAHFKLASEYCKERIVLDAKLSGSNRWVHREIIFSKPPGDNPKLKSVIREYAEIFWQREPTPEEQMEIEEVLTAMVGELPKTASSLTPLLTGICTLMATSFETLAVY